MKNRSLLLILFVVTTISITLAFTGVMSSSGALWLVLLVALVLFSLWMEKRYQEKLELVQQLKLKHFCSRLNREFPKQK